MGRIGRRECISAPDKGMRASWEHRNSLRVYHQTISSSTMESSPLLIPSSNGKSACCSTLLIESDGDPSSGQIDYILKSTLSSLDSANHTTSSSPMSTVSSPLLPVNPFLQARPSPSSHNPSCSSFNSSTISARKTCRRSSRRIWPCSWVNREVKKGG